MKNLVTCLVVCVLSGAAFADTWTVDDDGKADFDNIQAAVNAASNGDEILVMPGTYTGSGDVVVNMFGKAVWLHSSGGQEVTIIDGEDSRPGIYCHNNETSNTIIEGFTITNGFSGGPSPNGGGMYNWDSSPTITDCTFESNTADQGGGMWNNNNSSPMLTSCTFTDNTANYNGGGMGGRTSSNPTLTNCTFTGNAATYYGGGMYNDNGSSPTLEDCTFTGNTTDYSGGGIWNNNSLPTLIDTTVCGNTPDQIFGDWTDGGGNTVENECTGIEWACCTNDYCVVSTEEDCNAFFGQWLGEETTCADNPCPTNCPGDMNGDGQVAVDDLLILIAYWGACP